MTSLAKNSSGIIIILLILFIPLFPSAKVFLASVPSSTDIVRSILDATNNTAVRGALLYGLVGQETSYGNYLGKTENGWQNFCASRNTEDCRNWQKFDCKDGYSNARHFDDILNALGYARKKVQVSSTCAMGFTQFEPNTWWEVMVKRGESFRDPWLPDDAVLAAALYLKDLGADSSEVLGPGEVIGVKDRIALQKYYCGANYTRHECVIYANGVELKARRAPTILLGSDLENQLRQLEEERNKLRVKFGQEPIELTPKTPLKIRPSLLPPLPPPPLTVSKQAPKVHGKSIYVSAIHNEHIYLIGQDTANRFRIEKRWLSSGKLDTSFGDDGSVQTDAIVSHTYDPVIKQTSIVFDENFIYYIANSDNRFGDDYEWRVEKRFISTGKPDISFGSSGIIRGGIKIFIPRAIAIDSRYMYIAGNDESRRWRIEKRFLADGSLASDFGSSGIIMSDATVPIFDYGSFFIHIDQPYMFVAGYDENYIWRVEKRLLEDGSLASDFGERGMIRPPQNTKGKSFTMPNSMLADSSYLYLGGGFDPDVSRDGGVGHIKKILLESGVPDSGFADNGDLFEEPAPGYIASRIVDLVLSPPYLYAISIHSAISNAFAAIERRHLSNGMKDETFGKGGEVRIDDPLSAYADNLAVNGADLYFIFGYGASDKWNVARVPVATGIPDFSYISNVQ